jgi:hypothetical protein
VRIHTSVTLAQKIAWQSRQILIEMRESSSHEV